MQNRNLGSNNKIKTPKNISILQVIESCSLPKKNRLKKQEKRDHFKNRPSCKGYSLCKIVTLGQKLKFQKTCERSFHKSFRVFLCLRWTPDLEKLFSNLSHVKCVMMWKLKMIVISNGVLIRLTIHRLFWRFLEHLKMES